jgi:EAL domain-containing protein (putative c-di-GMP-specific phosphodiesterase class I)
MPAHTRNSRQAPRVAVNLSPIQFEGDELVGVVTSALTFAGLPARRLELEITETVLLRDAEHTRAQLDQLRALGVRICLDDFGTGYSSLSYLHMFSFDKIKIDRSFVCDLPARESAAAIVGAIASIGASLRLSTTAEGVETDEQLAAVRANGCTEAQGYLLGRPTPSSRDRIAATKDRVSGHSMGKRSALEDPTV